MKISKAIVAAVGNADSAQKEKPDRMEKRRGNS